MSPTQGVGRLRKIAAKAKSAVDVQQNKKINTLSKIVRADLRYNQIVPAATRLTSTAGFAVLLNGMVTGTIDGTRNGSKIAIKSVKFRLQSYNDANAGATTTNVSCGLRCMLVYDKKPAGAIFANAALLDNNAADGNNWLSLPSFVNRDRFRILWDRTFELSPKPNTRQAVGGTTYESDDVLIFKDINFKNPLITEYIAGAGGGLVADIVKGSLYLVFYPETANFNNVWVRAMITYNP